MADIQDIQMLERLVWGNEPIPLHQTLTVARNGGIIIGAYEGEDIVGFNYGFPGFRDGLVYLCSHMTGIRPGYEQRGLGYRLKEEQRKMALEQGYNLIRWTFDPLISLNAYFNLRKLGAVALHYSENHYGEMRDTLNRGLPSDRFTVDWWIAADQGEVGSRSFDHLPISNDNVLLRTEHHADGWPTARETAEEFLARIPSGEAWFVPIPADFQSLKQHDPDRALDWRLKTRRVFQALISCGFVGVDVRRDSEQPISYYVFIPNSRKET